MVVPLTLQLTGIEIITKSMVPYLVIWRDRLGQYRLTLRAGNNEIIFTTEGYVQKASAENAARIVKTLNSATRVVDLTLQSAAVRYS